MPKPKLGSTHDAGISPRKEAARGRGVSRPPPPVFVPVGGRQSVSSCHSGARSLSPAVGTLSPPPSPGDVYLQGNSGAGLRRAWGLERPTRAPTFCCSWGGGQGLPGSAFVFPTPITFAEVLPARGTPRRCPAPRG